MFRQVVFLEDPNSLDAKNLMKSSLRSDEIKSVFYSCEARFHHEVISSALADLFRRKTDLVEKDLNFLSKLRSFSGTPNGNRTHN